MSQPIPFLEVIHLSVLTIEVAGMPRLHNSYWLKVPDGFTASAESLPCHSLLAASITSHLGWDSRSCFDKGRRQVHSTAGTKAVSSGTVTSLCSSAVMTNPDVPLPRTRV